MNNRKEYVICAAVHFLSEKVYEHQPKNITNGYVICGRRHHNCYFTKFALLGLTDEKLRTVQGFLTSRDRFIDRMEGMKLALEVGQIDYDEPNKVKSGLFSEDLY